MESNAVISQEVLARYAADAAREVAGVHRLVESHVPYRRAVRLEGDEGALRVELHLALDWGASITDVGRAVQTRVREYLVQMANVEPVEVDVVVDEIAAP